MYNDISGAFAMSYEISGVCTLVNTYTIGLGLNTHTTAILN